MKYTMEELDAMDGYDFEYAIADLLFHNGYRDITVTQGSGDFGIDILARRKNVKYAIQCKRYKNTVGVKAVQEAGVGTDFYHCDAAAVITNSIFTKQAINLARTTGVRLWDRNFLEELIDNYDDEYDEIDSQFAQTYGSQISRLHNQFSVSEKMKKGDKGIKLAKNVYAKKGYIYFGTIKIAYIGVKILNYIIFWISLFIIFIGIMCTDYSLFDGAILIVLGVVWLICHNQIKKVLSKYKEAGEKKQL